MEKIIKIWAKIKEQLSTLKQMRVICQGCTHAQLHINYQIRKF